MRVPALGTEIPAWSTLVLPDPMKLYAALARDPTPIHWAQRPAINQGPLNVGYILNMLMAWAGPAAVTALDVRFTDNVLDGDAVTARGVVTQLDGQRVTCDVWLEKEDGSKAVQGTAIVMLA
jgi:3-hydroxybutyryl-CoA dehydratase